MRGMPEDFVDDMAAVRAPESNLLWTVDMLMDGVHFDSRTHSWAAIGRKAMAVNLSDCAAMAVQPVSALCAVTFGPGLSAEDALALLVAADELGREYDCPIVGGDTNSWGQPTVISITVAARPLPDCPPVRRDGARLGDHLFVSGPLGGSLLRRHLTFEPRVKLALEIARQLRPGAMIDITDGLAIDLSRILEASGCGATLEAGAIDQLIHPDAEEAARQDGRPVREHVFSDGEDFELLVVVPPPIEQSACMALGLTYVGRIDQPEGLFLLEHGRRTPLESRGWEHFR